MRKYLENGREVEVVQEIIRVEGDVIGIIIRDVFEEEEDKEENMGSPYLYTGKLFTEPPQFKFDERTQRYDKQIVLMQATVNELIQKKNNLQQEVQAVEKNYKDRIDMLQRYKGLERLEDFLLDKITHFIISYEEQDNTITYRTALLDKENFLKEDCNDAGLRLLCLYGDSKGNLNWRANSYRDGSSGTNHSAIPCFSYEDALEKLTVMFQKTIDKIQAQKDKEGQYNFSLLVECIKIAKKYNLLINSNLVEACKNYNISRIDSLIDGAKQKIAEHEESKKKCEKEFSI
jgi:FtsZ-binding cell division protein ZapB